MHKRFLTIVGLSAVVSACSIQQHVDTTELPANSELCVVKNTDVRQGFLSALQSSLDKKGIRYRLVDSQQANSCTWAARYSASWSWDLALYMSYAEINIYHKGALAGKAVYDSTRGGGNLGKFIDAKKKIDELVNKLLVLQSRAFYGHDFG